MHVGVIESFFLIFSGAALLATLALYTRQPLLVAYIGIGMLLGPHALGWIPDAGFIEDTGEIGIIFLLFLLGLDLPPNKLRNMLGASVMTALGSTAVFFTLGFGVMWLFGFGLAEALVAGIAAVFSSTIIGIKLLPTTVLHHRHIGEIVISLLLIQDLLAIVALLVLAGYDPSAGGMLSHLLLVVVGFPAVAAVAFFGVRFVVIPLLARFDAFNEFVFLLAIGWCLAIASLSQLVGMSLEVGAIVAGVSLANSPIAQYITDTLRPLRDFFLILFFFAIGAAVDPMLLIEVAAPAGLLAGRPPRREAPRLPRSAGVAGREPGDLVGDRCAPRSGQRILDPGHGSGGKQRAGRRRGGARNTRRHGHHAGRLDLSRDLSVPKPHRGVRAAAPGLRGSPPGHGRATPVGF